MEQDPLFGISAPELGWVPAPRYTLRRARVLALAAPLAPGRLLEVGAGAGALLRDFEALGFDCDAVESSPAARAVAAAITARSSAIRLHRAPQAGWDDRFDVVAAFEVLEHLADDRAALREWVSWIRPGGRLLLSVPARQRRWSASDVWAGHYRRYEWRPLERSLVESRLTIEHFECYGFPLSNLVEPVRALSHARRLAARAPADRAQATAVSGVERTLEGRLFPLQASAPGRAVFRIAFRLQELFGQRDWGTGYLVLARKPPSDDGRASVRSPDR